MICVNELTDLKCNKREVLEPLAVVMAPFAPHIAEELWGELGHQGFLSTYLWPDYDETALKKDTMLLVVQVKGKVRAKIKMDASLSEDELKKIDEDVDEIMEAAVKFSEQSPDPQPLDYKNYIFA